MSTSFDDLIEHAREVLDGHDVAPAKLRQLRDSLVSACEALERAGDRERLADGVEQLVEAYRMLDRPVEAVEHQRRLVELRAELHGADSSEVAEELRWLGEMWWERAEAGSSTDGENVEIDAPSLRAADAALLNAYRRFASAGPGNVDAIETIVRRMDVAMMFEDRTAMLALARELLATAAVAPRKREHKRIAKMLDQGARGCDWMGLGQPADALARRAAELAGREFVSFRVEPATGDPRLVRIDRYDVHGNHVRIEHGELRAGAMVQNEGGAFAGLTFVCEGPGLADGRVGAIECDVERGDDRGRVTLTRESPGRASGGVRHSVAAGVANARALERLGASALSDARERTVVRVSLTAKCPTPDRVEFVWRIEPFGHAEGAVIVNVNARPKRPRARSSSA